MSDIDLHPDSSRLPTSEERLLLVEEVLRLGTQVRTTANVRVRSVVDEFVETLHGEAARETVSVERVACDREVEAAPEIRVEGDITIMHVVEERLVLVKKLFVTEELHIRRERTLRPVVVDATRRVMRAIVEREPVDATEPTIHPVPPTSS